ncbi:MAG: hypothetical protein JSS34_07485 [Proteobacteria bacterium]|nr:hypothetical protein [Pseudomonadota bacterium]
MKIRNIIMLSFVFLVTSTFNAYSFQELDDMEKQILRSGDPTRKFVAESEELSTESRQALKTKFNEGNIIKVTLLKPYEVQKGEFISLQFSGQVLTHGRQEQILEHLWVNNSVVAFAKSYLIGRTSSAEEGTQWALEYRPTESFNAASQLWPDTLIEFLHLVITDHQAMSSLGSIGTKIYNLDIQAPYNHADELMKSNLMSVPGVKITRTLFNFTRS